MGWPGRLLVPALADRGEYVGPLQPVGEVVLDSFVDGSFFRFTLKHLPQTYADACRPAVPGDPSLPGDQWFAAPAALGDSGEQVLRDVAVGGAAVRVGQKGQHPVVGVGAVERQPRGRPDHFGFVRIELVVGADPFPVLVPFNCSAISEANECGSLFSARPRNWRCIRRDLASGLRARLRRWSHAAKRR